MARSRKVNVIDGLTSVQAVRRTGRKADDTKFRQSQAKLPAAGKPAGPQPAKTTPPAGRISQTAIPQRNDIVCYQCGYRFVVAGALKDSLCPKCRVTLEARQVTIETEWTGTVRTIGTVEVKPGATLKQASIVTRNMILNADATGAHMTVTGLLELGPGARIDGSSAALQDVKVRPEADVTITEELACRDLDVHGKMKGPVRVSGCMTVRENGCYSGTLRAGRLVVEPGAGLLGDITAVPDPGSTGQHHCSTGAESGKKAGSR